MFAFSFLLNLFLAIQPSDSFSNDAALRAIEALKYPHNDVNMMVEWDYLLETVEVQNADGWKSFVEYGGLSLLNLKLKTLLERNHIGGYTNNTKSIVGRIMRVTVKVFKALGSVDVPDTAGLINTFLSLSMSSVLFNDTDFTDDIRTFGLDGLDYISSLNNTRFSQMLLNTYGPELQLLRNRFSAESVLWRKLEIANILLKPPAIRENHSAIDNLIFQYSELKTIRLFYLENQSVFKYVCRTSFLGINAFNIEMQQRLMALLIPEHNRKQLCGIDEFNWLFHTVSRVLEDDSEEIHRASISATRQMAVLVDSCPIYRYFYESDHETSEPR